MRREYSFMTRSLQYSTWHSFDSNGKKRLTTVRTVLIIDTYSTVSIFLSITEIQWKSDLTPDRSFRKRVYQRPWLISTCGRLTKSEDNGIEIKLSSTLYIYV